MQILRRLAAVVTGAVVVVSMSGAASRHVQQYADPALTLNAEPVSANRATFHADEGDRLSVVLRRGTLSEENMLKVTIRTPDGDPVNDPDTSAADLLTTHVNAWTSGTFTVEVAAPSGGTGTLQLVGTTRLTTTINGPAAVLPVKRIGERVFVTFPAVAGKRFTVVGQGNPEMKEIKDELRLSVNEPGGRELGLLYQPGYDSGPAALDFVAPATGTYSLEVIPREDTVGTMTVHVTAPAEPKPVTVNGPDQALTFSRPGEELAVAFPATEGQRLFVVARGTGLKNTGFVQLTAEGPDGRALGSAAEETPDLTILDFGVHRTGRHLLRLNAAPLTSGKVDLSVFEAATATAKIGGPAVEVDIDRPGRPGFVTVPAEAGQHLTAVINTKSISSQVGLTDVTVRSPHGTELGYGSLGAGTHREYGDAPFTTRVAGPHTVEIRPSGLATGRFTVQIAGSSTISAKVDGPAVTAEAPAPGGRAFVRFDVTAGQWLDVVVQPIDESGFGPSVRLLAPDDVDGDGTKASVYAGNGETITFSPPASGTYQLEVDPDEDRGGSVTVQIKRH
ncbi:PPC domain-containing protein [Actinoplanes sp. NPDC026670]|uniref:PPC domain-containing protein n=1 Tax=Actinoplanes sp. NPDC026670 TaxID=3154700 RepID=UPI0033CFA9C3